MNFIFLYSCYFVNSFTHKNLGLGIYLYQTQNVILINIKIMLPRLSTQTRTTEASNASENIIMAYKKRTWEEDAHMVGIFTNLETVSNRLTLAISRSKAESKLEIKDAARDENVKALNYLLLSAIHNPDAAVKAAAKNLTSVFAKYGLKMTHKSYATETALINSMLKDLSAPELQADIAAISDCSEIIRSLQATQNDFKTTYLTWEEEKAQEGLTQSATEIKKDILTIINEKIVVHLNAMQQVDRDIYGELALTVSQIISDTNEAVKKRTKKEVVEEEVVIENA